MSKIDITHLKDTPQVVKFLSREPLAVIYTHWVQALHKYSWTCAGENCPLCIATQALDPFERPRLDIYLPVLNLSADAGPQVQALSFTGRLQKTMMSLDAGQATGPIESRYYALSRAGARGNPRSLQVVIPVKERDLEDYGIDPANAAKAVASAVIPEGDLFPRDSHEELAAVARSLLDF